jgi:hypothetical protein
MNRINIFQLLRSGRFSALVALVGLGLLFSASGAKAGGCGFTYKKGAAPSIPFVSPPGDDSYNQDEPATIVGLWHLIYTATYASTGPIPFPPTPPGTFQFLESYKTWHGDGTEFENAFMAPAGGNICFGVWKDSSNGSVKLHHVGLMFDSVSGSITNTFTVDETDTVARNGKTYSGFFDFKLFAPTDVYGTGTPLQEVRGTTAGTRISVD